jgi:hypothetical protein
MPAMEQNLALHAADRHGPSTAWSPALRSENDEFPFDLAERLKRRADTAEATANASKQMLAHVHRVQNALNIACLLRDPQFKATELKLARGELDKAIAILERTTGRDRGQDRR